ncbi:helix-hairpin-helix domain-containing protein, partial [Ferruginibacter sp.]|uniref:helix-hairpin-helix domain-containing protein n=1 Tax=Ferruginibacter sp. TaxID=1940288 RepID=UPI0019CDF16A
KKQRNGTLALLLLIVGICLLPFIFPFFIKPLSTNTASFEKEIATLKTKQVDSSFTDQRAAFNDGHSPLYEPGDRKFTREEKFKGILFYFNPNTLDAAGWKKLGVREKAIITIQKYISKGGKFYKPEDLGKIWGLSGADKERLIPFVQIEKASAAANYSTNNYSKPIVEKKTYIPQLIDINVADTSAFIALPGIGSKLSQRIISFRDKLGGFYKIEQVAETFGLADSTFQKIKPKLQLGNPVVKQLSINSATADDLKLHPYLRYAIANAIVQYRSQHGNYAAVSDLKKIVLITDDVYNKMLPYLTL